MKNTLVQYTSLIQEIKELEEDIDKIKSKDTYVKDTVKGSNSYFPYQEMNYNIEGVITIDTTTKENILIERKNNCEELKLDIERFISEIDYSLTRRIFRYRYIDCLSWQAIAMRLNKVHESYPRKIHDRYLEEID